MMGSTTTSITSTVVLTEEAVGDQLVGDDPAWRIFHYYGVYKPNAELSYSI